MLLVVIRHAVAMSREEFARTGEDDSLRPLTPSGRRKMDEAAKGIHQLVPELDLIASSPLTRAQQTARIVASQYDEMPVSVTRSLDPESDLSAFLTWLRDRPRGKIAVVGHEPHLGTLVTWLLTGVEESRLPLRKGAACLLEFPGRPAAGEARLHWALTASHLKRVAR
jgi:phosphohistidine phosphatase